MNQDNVFFEILKGKTESELQAVLKGNGYSKEAKDAAAWILEHKTFRITPIKLSQRQKLSFFVRTFSYREVLSAFFTATLVLCLILIRNFYESERYFNFFQHRGIEILVFLFVLSINHLLYRIEHGRSNTYLGRVLHGLLYCFFYYVWNQILGYENFFYFITLIKYILGVCLWEMFISIFLRIKRMLR